jgi:hypothetical protein
VSRELKILHIETSGAARDLLDTMHTLISSDAWALFEELVRAAYSDEVFAGQATTIMTTTVDGSIERKMADIVGRRAAARYIIGLPKLLMHECQAMLAEEARGVAPES